MRFAQAARAINEWLRSRAAHIEALEAEVSRLRTENSELGTEVLRMRETLSWQAIPAIDTEKEQIRAAHKLLYGMGLDDAAEALCLECDDLVLGSCEGCEIIIIKGDLGYQDDGGLSCVDCSPTRGDEMDGLLEMKKHDNELEGGEPIDDAITRLQSIIDEHGKGKSAAYTL